MTFPTLLTLSAVALNSLCASELPAAIKGDYLEVRSCDVYTGSCFANSEMNLAGKEGMMFWSVREGSWNGVKLDGLSIMAVLEASGTLMDMKYQPRTAKTVLLVDEKASASQKMALTDLARKMGGTLLDKVVDVRSVAIESRLATCDKMGCASVKAGDVVQITTTCISAKHDVCGNEQTFYPPLSKVEGAYPVFAELASYTGTGLGVTWQIAGKRSAFLASFSATTESQGSSVALR